LNNNSTSYVGQARWGESEMVMTHGRYSVVSFRPPQKHTTQCFLDKPRMQWTKLKKNPQTIALRPPSLSFFPG